MMLHSHTQLGCRFTKPKGVAELQHNTLKSAYAVLVYREQGITDIIFSSQHTMAQWEKTYSDYLPELKQ